jgi:aldose 1-epimerase
MMNPPARRLGTPRPRRDFTLKNANGIEVRAITYGGIITSIKTPDRAGAMGDIVLGFDSIDGYLKDHPFFGAIIGRYGNACEGPVYDRRPGIHWGHEQRAEPLHGGRRGRQAGVAGGGPGADARRQVHAHQPGREEHPGTLQVKSSTG